MHLNLISLVALAVFLYGVLVVIRDTRISQCKMTAISDGDFFVSN